MSDAERCPREVERALDCQGKNEEGLLCSNVIAEECHREFAVLRECVAGKRAPALREEAPEAASAAALEGFERVESASLGVSLLVPSGAGESSLVPRASGKGGPTLAPVAYLGAQKGGIEYFAELLPKGVANPSDKTILKTALDYLGLACQPKLKLHGRFEKGETIHVRFDTTCGDGVVWHGLFLVRGEKTVVVAARRPANSKEEFSRTEDFLFEAHLH